MEAADLGVVVHVRTRVRRTDHLQCSVIALIVRVSERPTSVEQEERADDDPQQTFDLAHLSWLLSCVLGPRPSFVATEAGANPETHARVTRSSPSAPRSGNEICATPRQRSRARSRSPRSDGALLRYRFRLLAVLDVY